MPTIDRKKKIQLITSIVIPAANTEVEVNNAFVDKQYPEVTGIFCSVIAKSPGGTDNVIENSVFNLFEIASDEVFPRGFEAKLIAISRNKDIPPDDMFYSNRDKFKEIVPFVGNASVVNIRYKDGGMGAAGDYPYTLNVYMRLENPDKEKEKMMSRWMRFLKSLYDKWNKENAETTG